jgi:glycosyltransferase involved in cell wall biosynthesis
VSHIKIIVPFYNVEKWILYNIRSIKAQKHKDFECIFVSDQGTDNTTSIIEKEIEGDDRFKLFINEERTGALGSTNYGIKKTNPNDEDILVVLDGDDWFPDADTLSYLNETYEIEQCWMTYGSYVEYPAKVRGKFNKPLPQQVIENQLYRQAEWMTSHLRTCKYKLWKRIKDEDMRNKDGKYYPMCGDLPVVFPMLEMSGNRAHYIERIMHVYNRTNPANEDKVNHQLQLSIEAEIRQKPKYDLIEGEI